MDYLLSVLEGLTAFQAAALLATLAVVVYCIAAVMYDRVQEREYRRSQAEHVAWLHEQRIDMPGGFLDWQNRDKK